MEHSRGEIIRLHMRVSPSFEPGCELQLVSRPDDSENNYWLHIINYGWQGMGKPIPVPASAIDQVGQLISSITTDPPEKKLMGLDGTTYYLEINGFGKQAIYNWWGDAPEGLQALEVIVDLLQALAGPACTGYGSEQEHDGGNRTDG